MDVINLDEGHYELRNDLMPLSALNTDDSSSSSDSTDQLSEEYDGDLREDLQKTVQELYQQTCLAPNSTSEPRFHDEEFQASALCQFMDILNDLDDVLDKSLLACLDESEKTQDSDEEDVVCRMNDCTEDICRQTETDQLLSLDDNAEVVTFENVQPSAPPLEDFEDETEMSDLKCTALVRSKSLSDLTEAERRTLPLERSGTTEDNIRGSMRRLDPIVLPSLSPQEPECNRLTLPVILFLEHSVNIRPTSAPMQVTNANLNSDSSGPLIVGRRALLMNRALSLPSPVDSDATGEWTGRNTARSVTRSASLSSSSSVSMTGVIPPLPNLPSAQEERNEETDEPPFGVWPHYLSCMLACLSCTLGLFNISRFAIFSVHFGANFTVQFLVLSFLIGIPLLTLYMCLGKVLEAGPIDMWRISPIFQGVGISMLIIQAVIGMYSLIGVSWIFVYFRDSFITSNDKYKWAMPHDFSIEDLHANLNKTFKIEETLPQYFHGEVLQRNIASNSTNFGTIKFQVAFNLAVVWMVVFVALSKGLRSYGKAVYILIFVPLCCIIILCIKLLTLMPHNAMRNIMLSNTDWGEFFLNSNSWAAAAQETFLTWGLLGSCIMQLNSHKTTSRRTSSVLQGDSALIVLLTLVVLLLASFLANACMHVLKSYGFVYWPGSFENVKSSQFLFPNTEPIPGSSTPVRYMGHYASLVGISIWRTGSSAHAHSGWQPLELATQIVPATLAVLPPDLLSPVWAGILFFILIMFGIAQQLAIWHCVIAGIMAINPKALRVWETTITFLSCVFGLAMGLLLTTDAGVRIVHFLDYVCVGSWWQCLLQVALVCGVFVVRGRPYSGEVVVSALYGGRSRLSQTLGILLSFTWNVILPVVLCAICVIDFRTGQQRVLYNWRKPAGYWMIWMRQLAILIQQGGLLLVPITAFIQTWRYMSKGPPDILDRIQSLYRPRMGSSPSPSHPAAPPLAPPPPPPRAPSPPPKYTPPPSYSTATGQRIINTLRRSFRTLRRITTTRNELNTMADSSQIPITLSESVDNERQTDIRPPQYTGVYATSSLAITDETDSHRPTSTSRNSLSFTRDFLRRSFVRKSDSVKSIRSSLRRSFKYGGPLNTSHEQLVRGAEPISNTVAMSHVMENRPRAHSRSSVI